MKLTRLRRGRRGDFDNASDAPRGCGERQHLNADRGRREVVSNSLGDAIRRIAYRGVPKFAVAAGHAAHRVANEAGNHVIAEAHFIAGHRGEAVARIVQARRCRFF